MPEEPPAHSGSRWEPPAGEQPPVPSEDPTMPSGDRTVPSEDRAGDTVVGPGGPPPAGRPTPSWRDRFRRPAVAAAAVGVVAAVGAGGFVAGRAAGVDDRPAPTSITRDDGTGDGDRPWSGQDGTPWDHREDGQQGGEGFRHGPDGQGVPGGDPADGSGLGS